MTDQEIKDHLYNLDDDVRRDALETTARVTRAFVAYIEHEDASNHLQHALTTARELVSRLEMSARILWSAKRGD